MVRTAVCIALLLLVTLPAAAQTQPTPTPDPEILRLQLEVEALKAQMEVYRQAAEFQAMKEVQPFVIFSLVFTAIAAITGVGAAAVFGLAWRAVGRGKKEISNELEKTKAEVDTTIRKQLNTAIYRVDPLYFPVHIPGERFETERKRLEYLGFAALRPYTSLSDRLRQGIVVYQPDAENPVPDLETLIAFMQDERQPADPEKVGFVIYHTRIPPDTVKKLFDAFPGSVTIANNAVTVASAIYAVARGLKHFQPSGQDAITGRTWSASGEP